MSSVADEAKALADEMLATKKTKLTFTDWDAPVSAAPDILRRLRESTLVDILVPDGDNLGMTGLTGAAAEYYGKVDAPAIDDRIFVVYARAWGWNWPAYPEYPDAATWMRQLDVRFSYKAPEDTYARAGWHIGFQVAGNASGAQRYMPRMCRDKWHADYAEMGYEGHDQKCRKAKAAECRLLIDLVADIARGEGEQVR